MLIEVFPKEESMQLHQLRPFIAFPIALGDFAQIDRSRHRADRFRPLDIGPYSWQFGIGTITFRVNDPLIEIEIMRYNLIGPAKVT